jgi:predicted HicB family RNase H-like nuclease
LDEKKAAQFKRQNDFVKNSYDRFSLNLPKGRKEVIRQAAEAAGMSINEYINAAIAKQLEQAGIM